MDFWAEGCDGGQEYLGSATTSPFTAPWPFTASVCAIYPSQVIAVVTDKAGLMTFAWYSF